MLDLEKVVEVGRLFSLYNSLLTDKQQELVELYYYHDLSLGEIANQQEISRQAVYDNLKRAERSLQKYDEKLQLTTYYDAIQTEIDKLDQIIDQIRPKLDQEEIEQLEGIMLRLETYQEGELE
ncbi:YlxM family DNA-binding protein [Halanaerobaculum tunisiense]